MVDGASLLATMFSGMLAANRWSEARGENTLDSGAPWYATYETQDRKHVAVGAIEPKFYAELIDRLGLARGRPARARRPCALAGTARPARGGVPHQDPRRMVQRFRGVGCVFRSGPDLSRKTRASAQYARAAYTKVGNVEQPAPAPRFARTPGAVRRAPPERGALGRDALVEWGFSPAEIDQLAALGLGFAR